jgi:hypothetical protein
MKKATFIIGCILLLNSINCFSQTDEKKQKEITTKTKHVLGYSDDFQSPLEMGIAVRKVLTSTDTTYYLKLKLSTSSSEYRTDICFDRASSITFLAKSGNSVDIKLTKVSSSINSDDLINDPLSSINVDKHSTTLIIEVTKEELIKIGADPFYKISLPYFNCSTKVYKNVVFSNPSLFVSRTFIQKHIYQIIGM